MPYTGLAAPSYNKDRKRFAPAIIRRLDEVQAQILQDPHRGDRKRGALRHVWVEKFKAQNDQWLVAYIIDDKRDIVYFVAVVQHENFYRDLQRRLTQGGRVEKSLEPLRSMERTMVSLIPTTKVQCSTRGPRG